MKARCWGFKQRSEAITERPARARGEPLSHSSTVKSTIVPRYDLRIAALVLILATALLESASLHGLYGDGANYLAQILVAKNFFFVSASRRFTEILTQLPVVLAIKGGLTNLPLLFIIH
jgi:hypothetical protein